MQSQISEIRGMGINSHAFNFVMCQAARAPLGRTLTIGRQSLDVDQKFLRSKLHGETFEPSPYCEPALLALGAASISNSLDVSDYENATIVLDLGRPCCLNQRFDTIVDFGSLEHIFDAATAFRNLIDLCEIGGRIIAFSARQQSQRAWLLAVFLRSHSFIVLRAQWVQRHKGLLRIEPRSPNVVRNARWRSPACASR